MPKNTTTRIISGAFRGQKLLTPGPGTHPMGARERLALFNMVDVADRDVLDLYAGSGALGLESLSRGARSATFVDFSASAISTIRQNLRQLGLSAPFVELHKTSVAAFVAHPAPYATFDIIFADPPYDAFRLDDLALLAPLLRPAGVLALSSPAALPAPVVPDLELISSRTYAGARISLCRPAATFL